MVYEPGKLIVKGRITDRLGNPKFRLAHFEFKTAADDPDNERHYLPETVAFGMDSTGAFRVSLFPGTNGQAWIATMVLTDFDGQMYLDKRTLPAEGEVDFFACPSAMDIDDVVWPEGETPILVSDFNKPGGPLQLTDQGTIGTAQMPSNFIRIDDERLPDLVLWNYITRDEYDADQNARIEIEFPSSLTWLTTYITGYRPIVECVQSDGTTIEGAVSYPVGTNTILVEWDAPTSGVLILR